MRIKIEIVLLSILILGSVLLVYLMITSTKDNYIKEIQYQQDQINHSLGDIEDEIEFYYWKDLPIKYYYAEGYECIGERGRRLKLAFKIIEQKTNGIVKFEFSEVKVENGIEIKCHDEYVNSERAGEGGIEHYVGKEEILKGYVDLYKENDQYMYCGDTPTTEIHEILHSMGFGHSDNLRSIMYYINEETCTQLDKGIISCLKHIYGNEENATCEGIADIND